MVITQQRTDTTITRWPGLPFTRKCARRTRTCCVHPAQSTHVPTLNVNNMGAHYLCLFLHAGPSHAARLRACQNFPGWISSTRLSKPGQGARGKGRAQGKRLSAYEGRVPVKYLTTRGRATGGVGRGAGVGPAGRERGKGRGGRGPPARRTTSAFFRAALRFCRMWRGWLRPSSPRAIPPRKQGMPRVSTAVLGVQAEQRGV